MLRILALPAFQDNYIWLLHDQHHAVVVDPGDAAVVQQALSTRQLTLCGILLTHHHHDHTGGVTTLATAGVKVYGPAGIAGVTDVVDEGSTVEFTTPACQFSVLAVPGHTQDHVAYYGNGVLLCGDTLFAGGCGRIFEGTAAQLHHALQRFCQLPDDTLLYCTHEYTLSNLAFALQVEPNSTVLRQRYALEQARRHAEQPTLPSQMTLEKQTNPFLRVHLASVAQPIQQHCQIDTDDEVTLFAALREWKNRS